MARRRKAQTDSAAGAREAKARKKGKFFDGKISDTELIAESLNDVECTSWTGGISQWEKPDETMDGGLWGWLGCKRSSNYDQEVHTVRPGGWENSTPKVVM
jgi:hypothetical protein